jgi:tRNA G10  N-methylase Trm11
MYLFVLGRQPEISLAELTAVFGNVELVLPDVALVTTNSPPDINRLGGTRKIGRVIYNDDGDPGKFLIDRFSKLPPGKITLGISHYGRTASASNANKTGVILKKRLNRSVRILPNSTAEISDAATLGNKLGTSPNKIELLMVYIGHRLVIAELIGVQNLNSYTLRDRGRPKRDARVGMLPPKLAQIMINLATGISTNPSKTSLLRHQFLGQSRGHDRVLANEPRYDGREERAPEADGEKALTLLDPFCGTGVILQEAALMGFYIYGTDIDPRMVEYTKTNLDWLAKQKLDVRPQGLRSRQIAVGDAIVFQWQQPIDFVVSETYLGQPYASEPPLEKLRENMATCNLIIEKFLINIAQQLKPGTPICLAIPVWFVSGKTHHLSITKNIEKLGFNHTINPLIYHRESQIVGRELLVLHKK